MWRFSSLAFCRRWSIVCHCMAGNHTLSGAQKAEVNVTLFISWAASKTEADFKEMVMRGQLNRQEIAKEAGFAKSVLQQNPRVRQLLLELESRLRAEGTLPPLAEAAEPGGEPQTPSAASAEASNPRAAADRARLKRLEAENAALKAELMGLRAQLQRYAAMDAILASSGRLPR